MKSRLLSLENWEYIYDKYSLKTIMPDVVYSLSFPEAREQLVCSLIDGTYEWSIPKLLEVKKDNGKIRYVTMLADKDRLVMCLLAKVYSDIFSKRIHSSCVSYQKGIAIPRTLRDVQKYVGLDGYKVDLNSYFDSVNMSIVNKTLDSLNTNTKVDEVIKKFYNDNRIYINGELKYRDRSICQGCAFGAFLSNIVLYQVDQAMSENCTKYIRYSDDMLLLDADAEERLSELKVLLQDLELTLNEDKTLRVGDEFTFLGGKVSKKHIRWSDKKRVRLRNDIHRITKRYSKRGSRREQYKCMRHIYNYLFRETEGFSVFINLCEMSTDDEDFIWLSKLCKDSIRSVYTGKHNFTTNFNKTSDSVLQDMGWCNLDYIYHMYKDNKSVYKCRVRALMEIKYLSVNGTVTANEVLELIDDLHYTDFSLFHNAVKIRGKWYKVKKKQVVNPIENLQEFWGVAKYTKYNCELNNKQGLLYGILSCDDLVLTLATIVCAEIPFEGYYMQIADDLVLFKEWTED